MKLELQKKYLTNPKELYTKSLISSVPPTNKKISRFKIIEKAKNNEGEANIKILNRWNKKKIISQDLIKSKKFKKNFSRWYFYRSFKKYSNGC